MATYKVKRQGKEYTVTVVDKASGGGAVTIEDRQFDVEFVNRDADSDSSAPIPVVPIAKAAIPLGSDGSVVAPIPGRVISIFVAVGDYVRADQVVLRLEAMKMENAITSPISGIVKEISVREGSEPSAGQILMLIA